MRSLIVTLDGPAGSGKSTVARLLAKRLDLEFLDTGAMYRGLTALCLDHGVDPGGEPKPIVALAEAHPLRFDWSQNPPRLYAGDLDITGRLRDEDVTENVSALASLTPVRQVLVRTQQEIGQEHVGLVTEGRDQGSVVFPKAQVKFYLDAQPHVRAKRRAQQLRDAGKPADEKKILEKIMARDERDSTRTHGPLICPDDAERIDTTDMSLEEVVDLLERKVNERVDMGDASRAGQEASS